MHRNLFFSNHKQTLNIFLSCVCHELFVFLVQNVIISPTADARLPLDGTCRKCCDKGPMTGKVIKLVCEYINAFPLIKALSAELKIVPL